jgi:hypothetical protein
MDEVPVSSEFMHAIVINAVVALCTEAEWRGKAASQWRFLGFMKSSGSDGYNRALYDFPCCRRTIAIFTSDETDDKIPAILVQRVLKNKGFLLQSRGLLIGLL